MPSGRNCLVDIVGHLVKNKWRGARKPGGIFFKNLNLSMGLEVRYFTPFNGYNYSPVMGQFMAQDTVKLNNLPDISAFFHFRIKSFTSFIRAENLNTVSLSNGFGFTNNNFAAPHYPTQGLMIRLGIQWGFVN